MENREKFSVSMCVCNKDNPVFFKQAVDSVIYVTYVPSEIVVAVDGPIPKETNSIIETYKSNLREIDFKVIYIENSVGEGNARRISVENCSNNLVAIMDADDISEKTRFEKQLRIFKTEPEISVVGSHIKEFSKNVYEPMLKRNVKLTDADIKKDMKSRCAMNQSTVMFKKNDVLSVGGYLDWYGEEDYYLWVRLQKAGYKFKNIDDCLVNVRLSEDFYKKRGGIKYFRSECKFQKYLYAQKIIGFLQLSINVLKRFAAQVLLPPSFRKIIYMSFARKKV